MQEAVETPMLDDLEKKKLKEKIKIELEKIRNYTPKVGVFGDSGVGKSSLCNALFGSEIAKISHTSGCTREAQEILIGNEDKGGIKLIDVPGVGENPERHQEYLSLYESLTKDLDLVLWAIKSVDRNNMASIDAYKKIIAPSKCPVVFVITQADLMNPHREWDIDNNQPGPSQLANLNQKVIDVSKIFGISADRIIVVSASDDYNLTELVTTIVDILPNEKKFAFTREAKDENVSVQTRENAEKGIFDHIKESIGDAWDYVKDDVFEAAKDIVIEYAPKIAKQAIKWFKKWF
ncbi:50S ribosome-binding GTPase [Vibrio parahaemolyticus]|nr:50S ribosome-binding GTPase [Vibrio parahaemolyticus]